MTVLAQSAQSPAVSIAPAAATAKRNAGLDALRATLTLLVLFHHTAITYGALGGWFYREVAADGRLETKLLTFFCAVNQAYFMGLFFLLAGYFTPGAAARDSGWGYLRERLLRLGLPLLIFGFIIGPATIALAQTAQGHAFGSMLLYLWSRGTFESGPLWFIQALLIFAVAFLAWQWLASRLHAATPAATSRPFPSNLELALAALATGAVAFALRLVWPTGTNVFGLQLGYFAGYIALFAAGCLGASAQWLRNVPAGQQTTWLIVALVALPVLPIIVLAAPALPALRGIPDGGWNIQALVYAFWEPLIAWGIILTLVKAFERRFATLGPIWAALVRRAYAIFIIHPPVLVGIAMSWRGVSAPHLVKFAVTGTLTCLACYVIAGLMLRVPGVGRVV